MDLTKDRDAQKHSKAELKPFYLQPHAVDVICQMVSARCYLPGVICRILYAGCYLLTAQKKEVLYVTKR